MKEFNIKKKKMFTDKKKIAQTNNAKHPYPHPPPSKKKTISGLPPEPNVHRCKKDEDIPKGSPTTDRIKSLTARFTMK